MPRNKPSLSSGTESDPGSSSPSSALALGYSPAGQGEEQGEVVLLWSDRYESEILAELTIICANDLDYSPGFWHRNLFSRLALRRGSGAAPAHGEALPSARASVCVCDGMCVLQLSKFRNSEGL